MSFPPFHPPRPAGLRPIDPAHPNIWYEFVDAWLRFPLGKLLDFGCGYGGLLQLLAGRFSEYWGVDIDPDKVAFTARLDPAARTQRLDPDRPLPFDDGTFDTVIIVEVIEHVAQERPVLAELARVLRPGGRLFLTTPHRGLLTFLDPGNFKFVLPSLHRVIHRNVLGQRQYYDELFGRQTRDRKQMVADFSLAHDPWHKHYRFDEIRAVAPPELDVLAWRSYFFGMRALWSLRLALGVLSFGRMKTLPQPIKALFGSLSRRESRWGDQLVVMFQKRGGISR